MPENDPRSDFRDLRAGRRILVVSGAARPVVNRVLFGLARSVSPSPYWVEIRGREPEGDRQGPADLGWIGRDRLFNVGEQFGVGSKDSPPSIEFALISFLRDPAAAPIAEAMRLPSPAGGGAGSPNPTQVVAVANVDRVSQLWPETPGAMRAVVRAFLSAGLLPFFSTLQPTKRRTGADFVFQVNAANLGDWKSGTLVCEQSPEGSSWKSGDSLPLARLPSISAALSGKIEGLS